MAIQPAAVEKIAARLVAEKHSNENATRKVTILSKECQQSPVRSRQIADWTHAHMSIAYGKLYMIASVSSPRPLCFRDWRNR